MSFVQAQYDLDYSAYLLFKFDEAGNSSDICKELDYMYRGIYKTRQEALTAYVDYEMEMNDANEEDYYDGRKMRKISDEELEEKGWKIIKTPLWDHRNASRAKPKSLEKVKPTKKPVPTKTLMYDLEFHAPNFDKEDKYYLCRNDVVQTLINELTTGGGPCINFVYEQTILLDRKEIQSFIKMKLVTKEDGQTYHSFKEISESKKRMKSKNEDLEFGDWIEDILSDNENEKIRVSDDKTTIMIEYPEIVFHYTIDYSFF